MARSEPEIAGDQAEEHGGPRWHVPHPSAPDREGPVAVPADGTGRCFRRRSGRTTHAGPGRPRYTACSYAALPVGR